MQICDCPNCHQPMQPTVMRCEPCQLEIRAPFEANEFARLNKEGLHFLRVFVHCEGRIKDMERALGVSYPTIKNKLAELKKTLALEINESDPDSNSTKPTSPVHESIDSILRQIESGQLSVTDGLKLIRKSSHQI